MTQRVEANGASRFAGIEDTARDQIAISGTLSKMPTPSLSDFTENAFGFQDAALNWYVKEPLTGTVFRATLSGSTLSKVASGSGTWHAPIGHVEGNGNITISHEPVETWDFSNATVVDLPSTGIYVSATDRLIGRDSATAGASEELTVGNGLEFTGAGGIGIANNGATDARIRDSGALSVIGRSANSTGDPADISATAASGAVLRESGSTLGFGTIATAGIADDAVTNAKLRNSAALTVIGRSANSAGDPADIAASAASDAVLRESGSTIGFGTIATAGIANNAVTDVKLRDSAALSVIGRSANSTGDPADIAATVDRQVLTRTSSTLAWGDPFRFHTMMFINNGATAVGAWSFGVVNTSDTNAGVPVPSGKTFKLWYVSATVRTGATVGANYDIELVIGHRIAGSRTTVATSNNNSNDTNVIIEAVATNINTPIASIAGPEGLTVGWGNLAGSTGAFAAVQHCATAVYSIE